VYGNTVAEGRKMKIVLASGLMCLGRWIPLSLGDVTSFALLVISGAPVPGKTIASFTYLASKECHSRARIG
jgi:hypothetical protein